MSDIYKSRLKRGTKESSLGISDILVQQSHLLISISTHHPFNMPKSWSKPFLPILKAQTQAWSTGKRLERTELVQSVADRIREDIVAAGDTEEVPDDLEDVCLKPISRKALINPLYKESRELVREQCGQKGPSQKLFKEEVWEGFFHSS